MNATTNLKNALSQLESFLEKPVEDDRDMAGIIQAFEFTFEQLWKTITQIAHSESVVLASPKKALAFAMKSGWIDPKDEASWLKMLEDRNLTTHTYQKKLAQEIFARVQNQYLGMIQQILPHLERSEGE